MWGSEAEVPSFLYAMPMDGGRRVFHVGVGEYREHIAGEPHRRAQL